MWKAYQQ